MGGASTAPQLAAAAPPVWRWFENCADKTTIGIKVTVDGKAVFESVFPICKTTNSASDRGAEQKILAFTFMGGRTFQTRYRTSTADTVEGNIWQAGADADALLLGVSFVSKKQNQILLNTIQIAQPDGRSVEEVDTGVFVETFPVRTK